MFRPLSRPLLVAIAIAAFDLLLAIAFPICERIELSFLRSLNLASPDSSAGVLTLAGERVNVPRSVVSILVLGSGFLANLLIPYLLAIHLYRRMLAQSVNPMMNQTAKSILRRDHFCSMLVLLASWIPATYVGLTVSVAVAKILQWVFSLPDLRPLAGVSFILHFRIIVPTLCFLPALILCDRLARRRVGRIASPPSP